jgi:hypothetical protein
MYRPEDMRSGKLKTREKITWYAWWLTFAKMIIWAGLHLVYGIYMVTELTRVRATTSPYYTLYILGYVVMGLNALAFLMSLFFVPKAFPAFLKAYEYVVQTSLFLLYAFILYTLNFFIGATKGTGSAAVPLLSDDSWYILSTTLKIIVAYFGFSNGLNQIASGIYALEIAFKPSFVKSEREIDDAFYQEE